MLSHRDGVDRRSCFFFFSSRRRHTSFDCDWSSDVCSSDLNRLGASALAQVYGELGEQPADLDEPQRLTRFAAALAEARAAGMLRAYHDRSDGGLLVTLLEMAFAGHCGLDIALPEARGPPPAQLFREEPGVVVQIAEIGRASCRERV